MAAVLHPHLKHAFFEDKWAAKGIKDYNKFLHDLKASLLTL